MAAKTYQTIILGGGVAGLCTAVALSKRTKNFVVITKKENVGEATEASAGILDPLLEMEANNPLLDLGLKANAFYPRFIKSLESKTKSKTDFQNLGMLYVAHTKGEETKLRKWQSWQKRKGLKVKWLEPNELKHVQPGLNEKTRGALYYPEFYRVNPRMLKKSLEKYLKKVGVRLIKSDKPIELVQKNKAAVGVRVGQTMYPSKKVLNATGCWAQDLVNGRVKVPVQPIRGQILVLEGKNPVRTMIHTADGMYMLPWKKGQVLAGSTVERKGFNSSTTAAGIRTIGQAAFKMVPEARKMRQKATWAGLRPYPKDKYPLLGQTAIKGYFLATGYYRSGILISPYLGEILAKTLISGRMPACLRPFRADRF